MSELLLSKALACRQRIEKIRSKLPTVPEAVYADEMLEAFLSFQVFLLIQDTVDLAIHLVTAKGLSVPSSQREAFEALSSAGIISDELSLQMGAVCGLRNRIAHAYGDIDAARLVREAPQGLDAVAQFLDVITAALPL